MSLQVLVRRSRVRIATIASLTTVSALLLMAPAAQAATCVVAGTTLTFSMANESSTLRVTGKKLSFGDTKCAGAPGVDDVSNIVVTGSGSVETLTIAEPTQLAPGVGAEATGAPEIELAIDLAGGTDRVVVEGGTGNDTFVLGSSGIDYDNDDDTDITLAGVEAVSLLGNAGNDTLSGAGDASTGTATSVLLTTIGGAGDDALTGGTRGDLFVHEPGADRMLGGAGTDTVSYSAATSLVLVTVGAFTNDGVIGERDYVGSDIEIVRGSAFPDRLIGSRGANRLFGLGGNDLIAGVAGADSLYGGAGLDRLVGGLGRDRMFGNAGADTFVARDGLRDVLSGGTGIDRSRTDSLDVRSGVERRF